MNYYAARQIKSGPAEGRWHYTCHNRRTGTYPVGNCTDHPQGHPTAAAAEECYREWMLEHATFDVTFEDWTGCEVCDKPTKRAARTGGATHASTYALCDEHRTATVLDELVPRPGEIWSS